MFREQRFLLEGEFGPLAVSRFHRKSLGYQGDLCMDCFARQKPKDPSQNFARNGNPRDYNT